MIRSRPKFWPLCVLAIAVVGCGSGFNEATAARQFQAANPDATDEQAECVTSILIDVYGLDGLETELERPTNTPGFQDAQARAMLQCGMVGDLVADLEVQLIDSGVPASAATCVAETMVENLQEDDLDVLLTGEITDDFYERYLAAVDDCGGLNP